METAGPESLKFKTNNRLARRIRDINNSRIALLINGNTNALSLAREAARYFEELHQCSVVEIYNKQQSTRPCPAADLKKLSEACDFLITAVGDTDKSAACSLRDGIRFEQYRKPALVVCTKQFEVTTKDNASQMGLPEYPFALVKHPVDSCTPAEIAERGQKVYWQGMAILTGVYLIRG